MCCIDRLSRQGLPATPRPTRTYNAFELRLRKSFRDDWLTDVTYVYSRLRGLYSGLGSSDENGRLSPNVDRDFDLWFLNYDSNGHVIDGPLGTDRMHQLKLNWAYTTPWNMEVGGFFRAMSGTPITRTVELEHVDVMVDNRGSDGENPAWTQTDLFLAHRGPLRFLNAGCRILPGIREGACGLTCERRQPLSPVPLLFRIPARR